MRDIKTNTAAPETDEKVSKDGKEEEKVEVKQVGLFQIVSFYSSLKPLDS